MRALTAEQMRAADVAACARLGDVALMRAAGRALAGAIGTAPRRVVAFAGSGNNGGDAFAALAELDASIVRLVYARAAREPSDARRDAEARAKAAGVELRALPEDAASADTALAGADVVLDGLLGVGGQSRPAAEYEAAIAALNARRRAGAQLLAIDVPTGVDPTTGTVAACAVQATLTVCLGAPKLGLLLEPARAAVGRLVVDSIGMRDEVERAAGPRYAVLFGDEFAQLRPSRGAAMDKRGAGAPLVIAGSAQFPGAAVLCARAAARAGAGYVTVATPSDAAAALRMHLIEQVVVPVDERDVAGAIAALLDLTNHASSVAVGPGLGLSDATGQIVRGVLEQLALPVVIDASALFHLAKHLELLRGLRCVVTPHEREFARLSGEGTIAPGTRIERLRRFVDRTGIVTLLKGPVTLIDDGTTMHVNPTGTAALATAGTGDVLSGIIATLLAQGLAPVDAARVGAYWHGVAGRLAGERRAVGVVAGDVIEELAAATTAPP